MNNGDLDDDTPHQQAIPDHLPLFTALETMTYDDLGDNLDHPNTPSPADHRGSQEPLVMLLDNKDGKQTTIIAESDCAESLIATGRTSVQVNAILEDNFQEIHQIFSTLTARVEMPIHQVVSRFSKLFSCTNLGNFWNMYQAYFTAHRAQELARLGEDEVVTMTPSKLNSFLSSVSC